LSEEQDNEEDQLVNVLPPLLPENNDHEYIFDFRQYETNIEARVSADGSKN